VVLIGLETKTRSRDPHPWLIERFEMSVYYYYYYSLFSVYATDRQTSDTHHRLMPLQGAGHNKAGDAVGSAVFRVFIVDSAI